MGADFAGLALAVERATGAATAPRAAVTTLSACPESIGSCADGMACWGPTAPGRPALPRCFVTSFAVNGELARQLKSGAGGGAGPGSPPPSPPAPLLALILTVTEVVADKIALRQTRPLDEGILDSLGRRHPPADQG